MTFCGAYLKPQIGGRRVQASRKEFLRRLARPLAVIAVCAFGAAHAQEVSFSGSVKSRVGAYVYGSRAGRFSEVKNTVSGALDASAFGCAAYIDGALSFDGVKAAAEQPFSVPAGLSAALKEAWFSWHAENAAGTLTFGVKAGRQISAWGKADGISIADVLCPKDMTSLYSSSYGDSRLGVDALKLTLAGTYFSTDVYWIPIFRPAALPLEKSNPLRAVFLPDSVTTGGLTLPVTLGAIRAPEPDLRNSAYGARLAFNLSALDFAFYGYYGFSDTPVLTGTLVQSGGIPVGITVNGEYRKFGMAAFDAAVPVKSFVLRTETAVFFDKAYSRKSGAPVAKNGLKTLVGADWIHNSWTLAAQYFEEFIFDFEDDIAGAKKRKNGSTLSVSRSLLAETLKLSLSAAVHWQDFDSYASISADYALTDRLSFLAAVDAYFSGVREGEFGAYKELSSVRLEGIFRF
ncbi:MAG: DUF1302 family protein [Treponema sp.]